MSQECWSFLLEITCRDPALGSILKKSSLRSFSLLLSCAWANRTYRWALIHPFHPTLKIYRVPWNITTSLRHPRPPPVSLAAARKTPAGTDAAPRNHSPQPPLEILKWMVVTRHNTNQHHCCSKHDASICLRCQTILAPLVPVTPQPRCGVRSNLQAWWLPEEEPGSHKKRWLKIHEIIHHLQPDSLKWFMPTNAIHWTSCFCGTGNSWTMKSCWGFQTMSQHSPWCTSTPVAFFSPENLSVKQNKTKNPNFRVSKPHIIEVQVSCEYGVIKSPPEKRLLFFSLPKFNSSDACARVSGPFSHALEISELSIGPFLPTFWHAAQLAMVTSVASIVAPSRSKTSAALGAPRSQSLL